MATPRPQIWKLRAPPVYGLPEETSAVDADAGFVSGLVVMQAGEISGWDLEADAETLEGVVRLGNAAVAAAEVRDAKVSGIKMRAGHPNASKDAIGTTVAASRNFRLDGDKVRADAQFLKAAEPEMRRHLLALAQERPDFFGTSLVVSGDLEKRLGEDGKPQKGEDGKPLLPLFRPTKVHDLDFVDRGAATPAGLFSGSTVLLSAEATEALDLILSRPDAEPRLRTFIAKYEAGRPGSADLLRAALSPPEDPMPDKDEPGSRAELTQDQMAEQLRQAGFSVARPAPPPETPSEGPAETTLLAELREMRVALAQDRAELAAERAKAAQAAKLAALTSRLDRLRLSAEDRKQTATALEALLAADQPEQAEALLGAYERLPNPVETAQLHERVSVPLTDGTAHDVAFDMSLYGAVPQGDDGRDLRFADVESAKRCAAIDTIAGEDNALAMRLLRAEWESRNA